MALSFQSSLSFSQISPLLFRPNSFSYPNSLLFHQHPCITITNAKTKRIESVNTVTPIEEEEEEEEVDEEDEEDEDGDEEFLAFEEMRRWEMKKPSGFGEGKVYNTTVEEEILEEMEKERAAKIAAEQKKKMAESLGKKKERHEKKADAALLSASMSLEFIPSGPTVRLANLPRKRNIHRDLQMAFKGFDGIVNITPVVSGNWKTREPVCKGLAFVELVSNKAANRFVSAYSTQDILFGKVQKQISFEYINPEQSVDDKRELPPPDCTNSRDNIPRKEFIGLPAANETKATETVIEHLNTSYSSEYRQNESQGDESSHQQKKQMPSRKKSVEKKSVKNAKLSLPSSMARLKIKERTVLTGVFSKYGGKVASGSD